jgi:hypothetical protein
VVGNLLAQFGDVLFVRPQIVAQLFEQVHILERDLETVLLGLDMREDKAFAVNVHDVFAQPSRIIKDPLTVPFDQTLPTHMYIAYKRGILTTPHYGHTFE